MFSSNAAQDMFDWVVEFLVFPFGHCLEEDNLVWDSQTIDYNLDYARAA